jgi:VanZ family protein
MLPLQHAALWRTLSILLLIFVLLAAMSPTLWFDSKVKALIWFEHVDKWLHAMTFAGLAVWFAGMFAVRAYWRIALGLWIFGLTIEGCQLLVSYRMAEWADIGANTAGIIVGLLAAAAGLGTWGLRVENWYSRRIRN